MMKNIQLKKWLTLPIMVKAVEVFSLSQEKDTYTCTYHNLEAPAVPADKNQEL
jgi:hypothetical protein